MKYLYTLIICIVSLNVYSQNKITGQIIDAVTEKPISSAFIVKVGHSTKPILTDKDGKFKLSGMETNDTLMFSATGYTPTMTGVGNAKKIKVLLNPEKRDNSVEIGYGSQDTRSLTSSVVVLEAKDLNKVLAPDIYSYLRGKIPGLQVEAYGYNPAVAPRIMLRGAGSFSATYEPLIVIDGVQGASLINLDPNDVKSVTVLKDASAQAIYGSRAAGGVIIIKTKGGKA